MAALDGQPSGEESPGSTETRCRLTAGGGDPRESATENRPPVRFAGPVRVKRWGKSPPRDRQRKRHGKPHREQDQIGAARRATGSGVSASPPGSVARGARQRASQRNGHPRPRTSASGWDRTRLTGCLTRFCCSILANSQPIVVFGRWCTIDVVAKTFRFLTESRFSTLLPLISHDIP